MEPSDATGVTGVIWRRIDPAREPQAEDIMKKLMLLSRQHEGFLGSEVFPPIPGVQDAYVVLYRFSTAEGLRRWLRCAERIRLLAEMETLLLEPSHEFYVAHRGRVAGSASTVLAFHVREGRESDFRAWRARILEVCRQWPGYLGTEGFDAIDATDHPEFIIVVRFDTRPHLDAWLTSPERKTLIEEVQPLLHNYRVRRTSSGFEGWFNISDEKTTPPAPWRQGLVILAALFPVIMTLRALLAPIFSIFPLPVAFLILLTLDLSVLTFLIMPRFSRFMSFWLKPKPDADWKTEAAGLAVILGILGATLVMSLFLVKR